jgi:hypothetical protein
VCSAVTVSAGVNAQCPARCTIGAIGAIGAAGAIGAIRPAILR